MSDNNLYNLSQDDWRKARVGNGPLYDLKPKAPPKIDHEVSRVVGHTITVNDSRLVKKVLEWKRQDQNKPEEMQRSYLHDPQRREELKKELSTPSYGTF